MIYGLSCQHQRKGEHCGGSIILSTRKRRRVLEWRCDKCGCHWENQEQREGATPGRLSKQEQRCQGLGFEPVNPDVDAIIAESHAKTGAP
jgi:hypothetical protein